MKKVYVLILIAVFSFTAGCKQDPAVVPAYLQNTRLLGKWYLKELVITQEDGSTSSLTDFSEKDFFEFRTGNAGTYSSSIYGSSYEGYYAANSMNNPNTLSFKSGSLYLTYNIDYINATEFGVSETLTTTTGGVVATTLYQYTYSRTL